MTDKPRLLWHSNAPFTGSGYGQQTSLFLPKLKEHFELGCSCFWGVEGAVIPWNGIPLYPALGQTLGNETIVEHAAMHFGGLRDGLVVTLMDVWPLDPLVFGRLNCASWCPVDHEPCPDQVAGFFDNSGAVPIAMSRFGEEQLSNAGLDPLYVPHAVDTSIYKPLDQAECREATTMPADAYIVGMVAANKGNPSRKCFAEAFQAFKVFHDRHPEARLYVHCEATGRYGGVDLPALIHNIGLDPKVVLFTDQYRAMHFPHSPEVMARIYNSLDCLLMPSAGEGFGVPAIEAQACGVPVIASDFSAQPELVGAGWLVSGRKVYTPLKAWQFLPDIEDIADALQRAYALSEAAKKENAKKARAHAETYDIDRVMGEFMLPALAQVAERFKEREPVAVPA